MWHVGETQAFKAESERINDLRRSTVLCSPKLTSSVNLEFRLYGVLYSTFVIHSVSH